jgi:hypothetical protein
VSGTSSVPRATFGPTGFIAPPEQDILNGVFADIDAACGGGLNPALETPQGQLATSWTANIADANDQFLAITNGVDPALATGRMQDGIARIYFITRLPALATSVTAICTGQVNVFIPAGVLAKASDGNLYTCTSGGSIGTDGTVSLQFTSVTTGPIACPAATLTTIYRGVAGWDSITNPTDGVLGNDVETPRQFELRRQQLVFNNAVGSIPAIQASVLSVPGILDAYTVDNPTGAPVVLDGVTIPANALYVCVAGGDPNAIASAIWRKKPPGCPMAGNTTITVQDSNSGYSPPFPSYNITFETAIPQVFVFTVSITNSAAVPSNAATQIRNAIITAFAGADGGARARIASTVHAARFYPGIAALGTWANIVTIKIGSTGAPKATFAASISGTIMTVTAISGGVIGIGQTVKGPGLSNNVVITSFGTGSGGTGTYNLSLPQTISSQQNTTIFADLDLVSVGIAHVPVVDPLDITVTLV